MGVYKCSNNYPSYLFCGGQLVFEQPGTIASIGVNSKGADPVFTAESAK